MFAVKNSLPAAQELQRKFPCSLRSPDEQNIQSGTLREQVGLRSCLFTLMKETDMPIYWGAFPTKSKKAFKTGWLISAGVLALYVGVIQPRERARGIASEKATGLAAVGGGVGWEPISLWRQTSILPHLNREAYLQKGVVGGVPVDRAVVARASLMTFSGGDGREEGASEDRKLVRTTT